MYSFAQAFGYRRHEPITGLGVERGNLPWGALAAGCAAVERGLTGTRLVISDAHLGLTAAISRMFRGCSRQRCRVHFPRNLLSHVPKAGQVMVSAAMKAVFVIQAPDQVHSHWKRVTEMLRKQFPTAVPVMGGGKQSAIAAGHAC